MAEPTRDWVGAHVFHRGDQDLLVTRAVAPVCEELARAGHVEDWFFLRYWEGGPHVRVRLRATAPAGGIRAAVARRCAHHLVDHPSPRDDWSQREYESVAWQRAAGERLTKWDHHLRPVDTLEFTAYEPEHRAYGEGRALHAVERHFTESSRIAVRLLSTPRDRRAAAALAMLTLAVAACEPDLDRAAARFAAARTWRPSTGDRRDDLLHQTRRLWSHVSADPPPGPTAPDRTPPDPGTAKLTPPDAAPPRFTPPDSTQPALGPPGHAPVVLAPAVPAPPASPPAASAPPGSASPGSASPGCSPPGSAPVGSVPAQRAGHAPADPLASWWASISTLHTTLTGLRARGEFAPVDALSPFSGLARALHPDDPLVAHVVLRCTHLLCNRLGLSSATEARLAWLTARTLSGLHGEMATR